MKKTIFTRLAMAAIAVAATGCQREDALVDGGQNGSSANLVPFTINATLEGGETKTTLEAGGKVYWESGDAITVLGVGENGTVGSYKFTTKEGGSSTLFEGKVELAENYYAVYPHTDADRLGYLHDEYDSWKCSVADSKLKVYFPSMQKVTAIGESATSLDAYSVGVVAEDGTVEFKNLGGLIEINIPEEGIDHVVLYGNAGETIVGNAYVTFGEDGLPIISSVEGSNMVRIVPAKGSTFAVGEKYYINVLPVNFVNGLSVIYTKGDTWASVRSSSSFIVERSKISTLPGISSLKFGGKVINLIARTDAGKTNYPFTKAWTTSSTSNDYVGKFEYILKEIEPEYKITVYSTKVHYQSSKLGFNYGKGKNDYIEFPSLDGYSLNKIIVRNSANGHCSGTPVIQNSDQTLVAGCKLWDEPVKPYGIEHIWSFAGSTGKSYRIAHSTDENQYTSFHQIRLYYAEASSVKPLITSVTTAEPETDPANGKATLHGSFTAVDCNSSAVTCGFDYKLLDPEQEWISVSCPQATSDFSHEFTAPSSEDYVYRAWTKVNATGKKVYGKEVQFNAHKLVLHLVFSGEEGKKLLVDTWGWKTNGNNSSTKREKDMNNLTYYYTYKGVEYPFTFWSLQEGVNDKGEKITSGGYCMRASSNPTTYLQLALNNLAKDVAKEGHPAWMQLPCPHGAKLVEIDCELYNNFKGVISTDVNKDGTYKEGTDVASYNGNDSFPIALNNSVKEVRYYFTTEHLNIPRINDLTLTYLYE